MPQAVPDTSSLFIGHRNGGIVHAAAPARPVVELQQVLLVLGEANQGGAGQTVHQSDYHAIGSSRHTAQISVAQITESHLLRFSGEDEPPGRARHGGHLGEGR